MSAPHESDAVRRRYARRDAQADAARYSLFNPAALAAQQERQRAMLRLMAPGLAGQRVLDVGCGSGGHLLDLLRAGATPACLSGIDLLPERIAQARERLPAACTLWAGDALGDEALTRIAPASQDWVVQFTVFSSILAPVVQQALAARLWHWLRPGGALLWYDFIYNNPRNPDVRGVPMARVRALFPQGRFAAVRRVTLAPPLARAVPRLYGVLNALPWLRTHVLCRIEKP